MAAAISAPHAGSIASSHPKRMEIQGFVSKKEGSEKPYRKMVTLNANEVKIPFLLGLS
jgi:hypothetical protein